MQKGHAFVCHRSVRGGLNGHIYTNKKLRISAISSCALLLMFVLLAIFPVASSFSGADAASVVSETTLAMSTEDIAMEFGVESPEGTFNSTSSTVSVTSNNYSGYTLSIAAEESTDLSDGNGNTIPTISSAVTEQDFSTSSTYNNKWGYKPSQYVDTNNENTIVANTSYLPGPSTTGTILDITSGANAEANTYQIGLGARVDYDTAAGTYKTDVVFAAVSNAITYSIYYDENTEDDVENMPAENPQAVTVAGSTSPSTTTLSNNTPVRAGHIFAGWCDEATTLDQVGNQVCGGNTFAAGATFGIDQTSDGSNTVIYAIWELESYTLTLDQNGATTNGSTSATVLYGNDTMSSITVPQRTYTVSGFTASGNASDATISSTSSLTSTYTFDGWHKGARSKKKIASGDATPELEASTAYTNADGEWINEGAVTLYAGWADGEVTLPTIEKTGYNCGWTTDSSASYYEYDSGESIAPESNMTMYGVCNQSLLINYDGNGLYFNNDVTNSVNKVHYDATSTVVRQNVTKYSHTANINDAGTQSGNYANNLSTNEVVAIDGATSLHVKLTYSSDSVSYDWVSFWSGSHSDYTASANYSTGVKCGSNTTGKYGGYTKTTVECDVTGDTLTFGFVSNSYSNGYGYYAVITGEGDVTTYDKEAINGEYAVPGALEGPYQFLGWSEDPNATTPTYTTETEIKEDIAKVNLDPSVTLYAVYEKGLTISFDNNGGSGVMANQVIYTHNPANLSAMSFTAPNGKPYFYRWNTKTNEKGVHYIDGERIEVPADTEIGDSITLYATWVNPAYSIQNLPESSCTTTSMVVIDDRDGQLYTIQRLSDGKCWMQDNLAINLVDTPLADLKGNTNASDITLEYLKGVRSRDSSTDPDGKYATSAVYEGVTVSEGRFTRPGEYTGSKDDVYGKRTGVGNYRTGGYYNPCAASAGSYCYNSTKRAGNAVEDICPAGWRMPTTDDFGGSQLYGEILSIPLAGNYLNGSRTEGNIWTVNWFYSSGWKWYGIDSSGLGGPRTMMSMPDVAAPGYYSVRCLMKYDANIALDQNGADVSGSTSTTVSYGDGNLGIVSIPARNDSFTVSGFTLPSENGADGAVVSSNSSISFDTDFAGWYQEAETINKITNNATTPVLEKSTSYADANGKWKDIRRSGVTLYAGWIGSSVTLPTISKTNYVCGWTRTSTGATSIDYRSGETVNFETDDITLYGVCFALMQNIPASSCTANPLIVADSRDNQLYTIQQLEDGNCWMLDNLAIDVVNTPTSALKGNTNASDITIEYLKGIRARDTSTDPNGGYAVGSVVEATQTINNIPVINMSSKDVVPANAPSGSGSNKVGGYYNYCAASAGSYCYTNTGYGNAVEDICPAGWRMPTGVAAGEYNSLYQAYSSNLTNFRNALSAPFSGYDNGTYQGSYGYFWSSTKYTNTAMNYLYIYSSSARPSDYASRSNKYAMRCLRSFDTPIILDKNGGTTDGTTSTSVTYGADGLGEITLPEKNDVYTVSGFTTPVGNGADGAAVSDTSSLSFNAALSGWYKESETTHLIADSSSTPDFATSTDYTDENGKWINTSHSAITLYAGWNSGSSIALPTITKQNYVCGWTETATGATSITYLSGAVVSLPLSDVVFYGVCFPVMQNLSPSSCTTTPSMVADIRDTKIYTIQRLNDGNCWLLDNLAIDLVNTPLNTLKSNTNASDVTLEYLKGVRTGTSSDQYAEAEVINSLWEGGANMVRARTIMEYQGMLPDDAPSSGNGNNLAGGYYNKCAASAGSYCYRSNQQNTFIYEDICPAGWRLPTGSEDSNYSTGSMNYDEYEELYSTYGSDISSFRNALSLPFSGYVQDWVNYTPPNNSHSIMITYGGVGRFWTTNGRYFLEMKTNEINFAQSDYSAPTHSVRCIMKDNIPITLEKNSSAAAVGTSSVDISYGAESLGQITAPSINGQLTASGFTTPSGNYADGATVSSTSNISYTANMTGWYKESAAVNKILDSSLNSSFEINTAYTDRNGRWSYMQRAGVTLYAGWEGTAVTLPTITKTGYVCGWTETASGATSITYASGATVNLPAQNTTLYGVCAVPMQTLTISDCSTDAFPVYDIRDSRTYTVKQMGDGNCWMQDNLAIDLVNVSLADLKGNTNASDTTLEYLKGVQTRDVGLDANGGYATAGVSNWVSGSSYSAPLIRMDNRDDIADKIAVVDGSKKIGGYYNYCAATAGSYCFGNGANYGTSVGDANEDICPTGWRMPTGGNSGEFSTLYSFYNSDVDSFNTDFSNIFSGAISSGEVSGRGERSYYWTTTRNSDNYMYSFGSRLDYVSGYYSGRSSGYSVRCVLK